MVVAASLQESLDNIGLGPDACSSLLLFDNTKLDTLLQAILVKMAAVTASNAEQANQIQALTARLDEAPKPAAAGPAGPDPVQSERIAELERRCHTMDKEIEAQSKWLSAQQAELAAAAELQSKTDQRVAELEAANMANTALTTEAKAIADASSTMAQQAVQGAATAQAEAVAARALVEGLDKTVKKVQTRAGEVAQMAKLAIDELKNLSERFRQLELANERLKGELGAIDALREAIGTLEGHKTNAPESVDTLALKLEELQHSLAKVEGEAQKGLGEVSAEVARLEALCLKSAKGGDIPASVNRELQRVHRALAAKADASFLEPLQRDVSSARQWQRSNEGLLGKLDRMTSDLNQKLEALAQLSTQIVNKADIDYVDEVNDIASMRETREISSLKQKFNELLNFLAAAAPNLLGGDDELYPRGTKMQLLRCISCDRGGSPPREDLRGADGRVYQGMDGKQKMAQQGVASPKKIEVRSIGGGGFRPRPSSAPAKRPASARVSSAAGVRTAIPEDGSSPTELDVSGRTPSAGRKQKGMESIQPRYG